MGINQWNVSFHYFEREFSDSGETDESVQLTHSVASFSLYNDISEAAPLLQNTMLKSTTRHVFIYAAEVVDDELVASDSVLTLDVDPDNEFNWSDEALKKVNDEFERLVQDSGEADLTDYNLRRIGSDLEHLIKQLLQAGEISYNLRSRVLNYSMGLPQVVSDAEANA